MVVSRKARREKGIKAKGDGQGKEREQEVKAEETACERWHTCTTHGATASVGRHSNG